MSITSDLEQILSARYGKDVRQAIHDSIEEGYNIAVQAQGTAETSADSAEAYANAALVSEQNAQDYMELAEQYKNEAFSGTPTGYADLVAKVNSIYKETASSFGVVDTVEGLALAHTIYGMSEQDGTPTPSVPVDIDSAVANLNCVGKNLNSYPYYHASGRVSNGVTYTVDDTGIITTSGTASSTSTFACHNRGSETNELILKNGTYQLSGCPSGGSDSTYNIRAQVTIDNAVTTLGTDTGSGATFTIAGDDNFTDQVRLQIIMTIYSGVDSTGMEFKPMVTLSDVDQTWEEYKSKTITTDLTLRAIEVTSSDDYNLVKDGKYYIADTLDWDEDSGYSITRRIGITQASTLTWNAYSSTINSVYTAGLNNVAKRLANAPSVYSKYFKAILYNSSSDIVDDSIYRASNLNISSSTVITGSTTAEQTEAFNTWLSSNDFELQYVLVTPTTETVTSAQAQALLGLKTYDEATSIDATGDVAPSVTLEYSKDRNTALALIGHNMAHINALKIADLSA